jgi:drug/metabolite transporter (DMT)-like permease
MQHELAAVAGVVLTVVSQVLLKLGARRHGHRTIRLFLNFFTIGAYSLLFVVTLFNLYAFQRIPLKAAVVLVPSTLLLVWAASVLLLKEHFSGRQAIGAALIVLGMGIYFL